MANKPGSIFYTHTPGTHWRLPTYSIQLRTWTWSYNLNLIGQDKMTVGKIVTDLAPGQSAELETALQPRHVDMELQP